MKTLLYFLPKAWLTLLPALLFACFASLSSAALLGAGAYIIASAALHPPLFTLALGITTVRFCGIARAACRYLERYFSHAGSFQLLGLLRAFAYERIEAIAPLQLRGQGQGLFLTRLLEDIDILKDFYLRVFAPLSTAALLLALAAGLLLPFTAAAALIVLGAFLLCCFLPLFLQRRKTPQLPELAAYKDACIDVRLGLREIKAAGAEGVWLQRLGAGAARLTKQRRLEAVSANTADQAAVLTCSLALLAIFALLIVPLRSGRLSGTELSVLLLSLQAVLETFTVLPLAWRSLLTAARTSREIFAGTTTKVSTPSSAPLPPSVPGSTAELLNIDALSFAYANSPLLLQNLSLTVRRGDTIAIVGSSGCGKSTLFHLILNLWQPQKGCLRWQGQPYAGLSASLPRARIGAVMQTTYIFSTTLRKNFTILFPDIRDNEILLALKKAGLQTFLASLPHGLDTSVGENGCRLSGGQRQRLGIARALARPVDLLLLDEATAGLDAVTAREVIESLLKNRNGAAVLFITHDIRLLPYMDRVLLLEKGQLLPDK